MAPKAKQVKDATGRSIVQVAVGKVAAARRKTHKGTPVRVREGALEEAYDELLAAHTEVAIRNALEPDEPHKPLSREQRERLAELLLGYEGEELL
jgi:hypothetical protein